MLSSMFRARAVSVPRAIQAMSFGTDAPLRKTPLYNVNVQLGGKMVEFGGWDMPVQYAGKEGGILQSHLHCRKSAGIFDVSHMIPVKFYGKDRAAFMEKVLVGDIQDLPEGMGQLSLITNEQGGIIDDCICTNAGDHLYVVINAGHETIDLPHIQARVQA